MPEPARPPRHQHREAYATIILDGSYDQFAYAGRLRVEAGDVLIQPTFDCHFDWPKSPGLTLLRLAWPRDTSFGGVYRRLEIDDIVSTAHSDVAQAAAALLERLAGRAPREPGIDDWADLLAADLRARPTLKIGIWAEENGVSREHLSRAFAASYRVTPARFRLELAARAAWLQVTGTSAPLAAIAHELGFSDQAHMTRAVSWLTGAPPTAWRRSHIASRQRLQTRAR